MTDSGGKPPALGRSRTYMKAVLFLWNLLQRGCNPVLDWDTLNVSLSREWAATRHYKLRLIELMEDTYLLIPVKEGWVRMGWGRGVMRKKTVAWRINEQLVRGDYELLQFKARRRKSHLQRRLSEWSDS